MTSRSVDATSRSNLFVFIVYSPLLAGTYSRRPTYSTSNTGFLPKVVRNSFAVLKVLKGGVTASMTPYSGTKTDISIKILAVFYRKINDLSQFTPQIVIFTTRRL